MSRNALRLYKTTLLAQIDAKISPTSSLYVLFRHQILHAVALASANGTGHIVSN